MTELRPLKFASPQAVSRLLLDSALDDHSAPGAADRALQALNLGTVVATTVVTVHAATSSSVGSHVAGGLVLKWLGLGLVAGATTLLSAERVMQAISKSTASPAVAIAQIEKPAPRPATRLSVAPAKSDAAETAPPAATAQRAADARPLRVADAARPLPDVSQAAAEPLQELHAIRRALADHAPERALSLLELFVARYPGSSLLEEARVLRFDALVAAGRDDARAEGENFLRSYPRSAYAERVRAKLSTPR